MTATVPAFERIPNALVAAVLAAVVLAPPCSARVKHDVVDAADRGDVVAIGSMLARGADVEESWAGRTPLIAAARLCRADAVKLLLDKGANVNARETCGDDALILAAWRCPAGLVEELLDHGANVNGRDRCTGETPLSCAAQEGRTDTVELLLARGAAVDPRTKIGFTPLTLAFIFRRSDAAKVLRAKGANVFSALWPIAAVAAALAIFLRLLLGLRRLLIRRVQRARAAALAAGS
jgi:ankyrin repeat protein